MGNPETIEFTALGTRLRLAPGEDPELVRRVAEFVQERLAEVTEGSPTAQPLQLALLTALNIAEQLLKEQQHEQAEYSEAVGRVRHLLDSLR